MRPVAAGYSPDGGKKGALDRKGVLLEKVLKFGEEDGAGDDGEEVAECHTEADEGFDGVGPGAFEDGLGDEADLVGEVVGVLEDMVGDELEAVIGERLAALAAPEGVEVVKRGAGPTAAGLEAVGEAAAGVGGADGGIGTADGPSAAVGEGTSFFVGISGHGVSPVGFYAFMLSCCHTYAFMLPCLHANSVARMFYGVKRAGKPAGYMHSSHGCRFFITNATNQTNFTNSHLMIRVICAIVRFVILFGRLTHSARE